MAQEINAYKHTVRSCCSSLNQLWQDHQLRYWQRIVLVFSFVLRCKFSLSGFGYALSFIKYSLSLFVSQSTSYCLKIFMSKDKWTWKRFYPSKNLLTSIKFLACFSIFKLSFLINQMVNLRSGKLMVTLTTFKPDSYVCNDAFHSYFIPEMINQ